MLYDIRTPEKAAETLELFTGVDAYYWLLERDKNIRRFDYSDADQDIKRLIKRHDGRFPNIRDFELIVTHITTSANRCKSILQNGIVDLKKSYELIDSELRHFLDCHGIEIILDSHLLRYNKKCYDISHEKCPMDHNSVEYAAWSVGRKFYYDYTVCGFLSINRENVYGGNVHRRPEVLWDIDKLLNTSLESKWLNTHRTYAVVFKIPLYNCVYDGWDTDSEDDMVMNYLYDAYMCVCTGPDTKEILCKNGVNISPNQILQCEEFDLW